MTSHHFGMFFFFRQMLFLEFLCVYNSMYPSSLNIIGLLSTLFWPKSTRFLWPWMVYISICGKEQFTFSSEFKQNVNFSDFLNSTHSSIDVNRFRVCRWCLFICLFIFFLFHTTRQKCEITHFWHYKSALKFLNKARCGWYIYSDVNFI